MQGSYLGIMPSLFLTIALLADLIPAAGFDCAKAKHPVERKICADARLSALDDSLGIEWKSTLRGWRKRDSEALRTEQRRWNDAVRKENPSTDSLRTLWALRRRELRLKRELSDLRTLVSAPARGGVRLEQPGGCAGLSQDGEEGIRESDSRDVLDLEFLPKTGRLRFSLIENNGQHNCNSCGIEGEAVRSSKASPDGPLWFWKDGEDGERVTMELLLLTDEVRVKVTGDNTVRFCGMGAGFSDTLKFSRVGLRLAP